MFKKIILTLVLLSNLIFVKSYDFKNEYEWAVDDKEYIDSKVYKDFEKNEEFYNEDPDRYWEQEKILKNWKNLWRDAGYGNQ